MPADTASVDFEEQAQRHRRELHVHCYRMLASFDEAEDAVQETFLRAWRGRSGFDGSGQFRAWLYRIATNVCLDMLRSRRAVPQATSFAEVPWIQPYPDRLLDEVLPGNADEEPEAVVIRRETISLAFLAALQALPPRQRAALIARDVLGWPAADTANLLGISVPAANSALQRARTTMQQRLPENRSDWSAAEPTAAERDLVAQFIEAHERLDAEAAIGIAAKDIRITMPPFPMRFDRAEDIRNLMADAAAMGTWRLVPVSANRMPGAASYLLRPGDTEFRAFKFDIIRIENGVLAEITTFFPDLFPAFALPPTLAPLPGTGRWGDTTSVMRKSGAMWIRRGAQAIAAARVAVGVTALTWPGVPARPWVGRGGDDVVASVFGRALGGRDLALGLGGLWALGTESDSAQRSLARPVRRLSRSPGLRQRSQLASVSWPARRSSSSRETCRPLLCR